MSYIYIILHIKDTSINVCTHNILPYTWKFSRDIKFVDFTVLAEHVILILENNGFK